MSNTVAFLLVRDGAVPLYRQVEAQVRSAIETGRMHPGDRLPGIRTLAADLGVARVTIATAYEQLAAEGYLVGTVGSGTRVASEPPGHRSAPGVDRPPGADPIRSAGPPVRPDRGPAGSPARHDLRSGSPRPAAVPGGFPVAAWEARLREALRMVAGGPGGRAPAGDPNHALRAALSAHLDATRGTRSDPSRVVVGRGVRVLLAALAAALERETGPDRVAVIGLLPPADAAWADTVRRAGAAALAVEPERAVLHAAAGVVLVEDDRAALLRLGGPPAPALQGTLAIGRVVLIGGLVPAVVPGTTLAWLVVPTSLASAISREVAALDGAPGDLEAAALAGWVRDGGLDRRLRRLRHVLLERRAALASALTAELAGVAEIEPLDHRPVVTIRVRSVGRVRDGLARSALRLGVAIDPPDGDGRVVLDPEWLERSEIEDAVRCLGRAVDRLAPGLRARPPTSRHDRGSDAPLEGALGGATLPSQPERGRLEILGRALAGRGGPGVRL